MGRKLRVPALVVAGLLSGSALRAAESAPAAGPEETGRPHGLLSHGDSSGFVEDVYGDRVERAPAEGAAPGARKHDPAVNWDDRRVRR